MFTATQVSDELARHFFVTHFISCSSNSFVPRTWWQKQNILSTSITGKWWHKTSSNALIQLWNVTTPSIHFCLILWNICIFAYICRYVSTYIYISTYLHTILHFGPLPVSVANYIIASPCLKDYYDTLESHYWFVHIQWVLWAYEWFLKCKFMPYGWVSYLQYSRICLAGSWNKFKLCDIHLVVLT